MAAIKHNMQYCTSSEQLGLSMSPGTVKSVWGQEGGRECAEQGEGEMARRAGQECGWIKARKWASSVLVALPISYPISNLNLPSWVHLDVNHLYTRPSRIYPDLIVQVQRGSKY